MTALIIIGIIIFVIARISKNKQLQAQNKYHHSNDYQEFYSKLSSSLDNNQNTKSTKKTNKEITKDDYEAVRQAINKDYDNRRESFFSNLLEKMENEESTKQLNKDAIKPKNEEIIRWDSRETIEDQSIIDISKESYKLEQPRENPTSKVPFWEHEYIYTTTPLSLANSEQQAFYKRFKRNFLNEIYLDIEDNLNYASILMFDLFDDYENHKNLYEINKQVKELSANYPKTKKYAYQILFKKVENYGNSNNVEVSPSNYESEPHSNWTNNYDYDYWKLGGKYKSELNLNSEQVELLNNIYPPSNNFFNIKFCAIEIMKLYLALFSKLKEQYLNEGTTRKEVFKNVADIIAKKEFRFRNGSENYRNSIEHNLSKLYENVFKICENTIREYYGHKRKLSTDFPFEKDLVIKTLEEQIFTKVKVILKSLQLSIQEPDNTTEIELNIQNKTRWKTKLKTIQENFKNNGEKFQKSVIQLVIDNNKSTNRENIFFDAFKFIAKFNKETALNLYAFYVYHGMTNADFKRKALPKAISKHLFETKQQEQDFEAIINTLLKSEDIDITLKSIEDIYTIKRKQIKLDKDLIKEAYEKHSDTVELLNEYLQISDEEKNKLTEVDDNSLSIDNQIITEQISKTALLNNDTINHLKTNDDFVYKSEIQFNSIQKEILALFHKNNFSISLGDLDEFTASKGLFKNQLIESINEACYEILDDVLIEEEDDFYTIYEEYYQTILVQYL
jgi:hypothetical protein